MRIPVPYEFRGDVITDASFRRPTAGALADTKRHADAGSIFMALATFVVAGLEELAGRDGKVFRERAELRDAVRAMPYPNANWASIQILLGLDIDDQIDAVNVCPRCGKPVRPSEDRIRDLPLTLLDSGAKIGVVLDHPIEIRDGKDPEKVLERVSSMTLRYPTLDDCIRADARATEEDSGRLQLAIYVEAVEEVDGKSVDDKWRTSRGMMVFERMDFADIGHITRLVEAPGYRQTVPRRCRACGKKWEADVDVSSFFASGLAAG